MTNFSTFSKITFPSFIYSTIRASRRFKVAFFVWGSNQVSANRVTGRGFPRAIEAQLNVAPLVAPVPALEVLVVALFLASEQPVSAHRKAGFILDREALDTQGTHASLGGQVEGQTFGASGFAFEKDNWKGSRENQVLEGRVVLNGAWVRRKEVRSQRTTGYCELLSRCWTAGAVRNPGRKGRTHWVRKSRSANGARRIQVNCDRIRLILMKSKWLVLVSDNRTNHCQFCTSNINYSAISN